MKFAVGSDQCSTIGQRQSRLHNLSESLNQTLEDIANVPTPSYREWRGMLP